MGWQKHYQVLADQKEMIERELTDEELFGKDLALEQGELVEVAPPLKRLPKVGTFSQRDIKSLLSAQNIFSSWARQQEEKKQAANIKRVNQSQYLIDYRTAHSYIVRALHNS